MADGQHPSSLEIDAWFDGEGVEGLGWHLATCSSCFHHVEETARIRMALRQSLGWSEPSVKGSLSVVDDGVEGDVEAIAVSPTGHSSLVSSPKAGRRLHALVVVSAAVVVIAALAMGIGRADLHGTLSASRGTPPVTSANPVTRAGPLGATGGSATNSATPNPVTGPLTNSAESAQNSVPAGGSSASSRAMAVGGRALSLAVVVPTQGPEAAQGEQITEAVQRAVDDANTSDGVAGWPVSLTVVSAEDAAAVDALSGEVDAVVGGFGASIPTSVPWILPADPYAAGADVVSTELSPAAAGARLGQNLVGRGVTGTVGVVVGSGPDAAMATGLAQEVPVTTVSAPPNGACFPALTSLAQQQVVAVAVAGPPSLAAACVAAFQGWAWSPPGGMLLAPSAAYAGIAGQGPLPNTSLYTALGLPWPDSNSPGAQRFRSEVPGDDCYQALVSFAAVEMAVQVARSTGSLNMASVASKSWSNDLYEYAGADNVGAKVVQETPGGWVSAS